MAGFPQASIQHYHEYKTTRLDKYDIVEDLAAPFCSCSREVGVSAPHAGEIIAALGHKFGTLVSRQNQFTAYSRDDERVATEAVFCSAYNPTEALAKLYLQLHKP